MKIEDDEIVSGTFDEWITHVFDHPPQKGHWRWNHDNEDYTFINWSVPASDTLDFLTRTFEESGTLLKRFTDSQVYDGLYYIAHESLSDIALTLWDESVPWSKRQQAVRSIRKLYSDCFAVRCAPLLSYLDKATEEYPLNSVCYMWWDIFPINCRPKNPSGNEIDLECLTVMEFALGLEHAACQESALHGLGHWAKGYPEYVGQVVDRFIAINPNARPELIVYAKHAREGKVQ